jgi:predicted dehydrogenase
MCVFVFFKEKHVLCEKAMGLNSHETSSMVEFARKNGVFLMEAIWSRTFPAYKRMKQLIKEGAIGEVENPLLYDNTYMFLIRGRKFM